MCGGMGFSCQISVAIKKIPLARMHFSYHSRPNFCHLRENVCFNFVDYWPLSSSLTHIEGRRWNARRKYPTLLTEHELDILLIWSGFSKGSLNISPWLFLSSTLKVHQCQSIFALFATFCESAIVCHIENSSVSSKIKFFTLSFANFYESSIVYHNEMSQVPTNLLMLQASWVFCHYVSLLVSL